MMSYERKGTSDAVVLFLSSIEEPLTTAAPLEIILGEYYGVHLTLNIKENGLTAVRKELIILLPTEPKLSKLKNIKYEARTKTNKGETSGINAENFNGRSGTENPEKSFSN